MLPLILITICLISTGQAYDYCDVIHKSILFFEAQRSGELPNDNRIDYRGDSALDDKGNNNEDLTGGWYDAGDHVKFGLPMAASATLLAWGIIEFEAAYKACGEYNNALDEIRWATDYFIKCHVSDNELYVQVGDGNADHAYWGRPEEMTMDRPAVKITTSKPGSDVAGETSAALAAASIVFKNADSSYSNELLDHAKTLFDFAYNYRAKYTDSLSEPGNFYRSYGYEDELTWAAAWLYKATGTQSYLNKATSSYSSGTPWALSWDDKNAGAQMLLYQLTGSNDYKDAVIRFLESWMPGRITYTPNGLAWRDTWGPLRYSANTAFIAALACHYNINSESCSFVEQQIHYMLGSSGRSFVVGFGENPPQRPHHRSSSCPDQPQSCSWNEYNSGSANPQTLEGALVGGPDQNDNYTDERSDYISNEVACDYNAGFQSAVAGLKQLNM
uniref:Endoglucanase n=1 Tax=Mesocentrotus nudus TaxID=7666 RepID=A5A7P3_MESNU|nr:cellulase [Mesocentrotus nudus]